MVGPVQVLPAPPQNVIHRPTHSPVRPTNFSFHIPATVPVQQAPPIIYTQPAPIQIVRPIQTGSFVVTRPLSVPVPAPAPVTVTVAPVPTKPAPVPVI